jgi:hypothetical protein
VGCGSLSGVSLPKHGGYESVFGVMISGIGDREWGGWWCGVEKVGFWDVGGGVEVGR